jgi:hypothetical protein
LERDLAHDERRLRSNATLRERSSLKLIHDSGCVVEIAHTGADIELVRRHPRFNGLICNQEAR